MWDSQKKKTPARWWEKGGNDMQGEGGKREGKVTGRVL